MVGSRTVTSNFFALVLVLIALDGSLAFTQSHVATFSPWGQHAGSGDLGRTNRGTLIVSTSSLLAAAGEGGKGSFKRKRKRRRKPQAQPPSGAVAPPPLSDPIKIEQAQMEGLEDEEDIGEEEEEEEDVIGIEDELLQIKGVASFEFRPDSEIMIGIQDEDTSSIDFEGATSTGSNDVIPLPDIKEARTKKRMEEEIARLEQEKEEKKVKIKRSDREAFIKLLERQPFADADDSFFEEEEYDNVSAILGERAKPFLGIPVGPMQVGHFVGALGIMLMAFVEYPGFPLTNLPTPLRDALQGGLATVYAINTILAVFAVFKAAERGQPGPLWAAKTFSVGGLAFDQLMQLPTLDEIEKAKARKGKRALKNIKSR